MRGILFKSDLIAQDVFYHGKYSLALVKGCVLLKLGELFYKYQLAQVGWHPCPGLLYPYGFSICFTGY